MSKFDITKHEFDGNFDLETNDDGTLWVEVDPDRGVYAQITEQDVDAMKRHFKQLRDLK